MPLGLFCLATERKLLGLLFYSLIAISDFWDGWLARRWNACSSSGVIMDQVCDKLVGIGFFGGLTWLGLCPFWFLVLNLFLTTLLGIGYLLSQFHPAHAGPQSSLRLGKWSTALQYLWIGWILFSEILFGKKGQIAYFPEIVRAGFVFLSLLQVWVFLQYAIRWVKEGPLRWSHQVTEEHS